MNDNLKSRYINKRPNGYCVIKNRLLLVWFEKDVFNDIYAISAFYHVENKTASLQSIRKHPIRSKTEKGRFIFRKGRERIYPEDFKSLPPTLDFKDTKETAEQMTKIFGGLVS